MRIAIVNPIAEHAVTHLEALHDVSRDFDDPSIDFPTPLDSIECVIMRSGLELDAGRLDAMSSLGLIVRAGSGFDNIDLAHTRSRGIRIVRVPGPAAQAVAEYTFGMMLSVSRNVTKADRFVRGGHWPKRDLAGNLLIGKTLGIVGVGNIGSRVGALGDAWGMDVIGCVGHMDMVDRDAYAEIGITIEDFEEVLRTSDYVTLHTPLDDTTRGLIGARELSLMKSDAYLINTARGSVVDESALGDALAAGHLAGVALDVHEKEGEGVIPDLTRFDNVVVTPHIGGMAEESQAAIGHRIIELIGSYLGGTLDSDAAVDEIVI
jgi:D-3-phosphoglycerate dehydrogenase